MHSSQLKLLTKALKKLRNKVNVGGYEVNTSKFKSFLENVVNLVQSAKQEIGCESEVDDILSEILTPSEVRW
jgi:hypothetical protein